MQDQRRVQRLHHGFHPRSINCHGTFTPLRASMASLRLVVFFAVSQAGTGSPSPNMARMGTAKSRLEPRRGWSPLPHLLNLFAHHSILSAAKCSCPLSDRVLPKVPDRFGLPSPQLIPPIVSRSRPASRPRPSTSTSPCCVFVPLFLHGCIVP